MWYVYIIRSIEFPDQEYTGAASDLKRRIAEHNAGKSAHTAKFKPWKLVWYCAFPDKFKALAFEKYLKSHSDRAFAKKRFQPPPTPPPPHSTCRAARSTRSSSPTIRRACTPNSRGSPAA